MTRARTPDRNQAPQRTRRGAKALAIAALTTALAGIVPGDGPAAARAEEVPPHAVSTFDSGTEGWRAPAIAHDPAGFATAEPGAGSWFWSAPSAYLRGKRSAYNRTVEFRLAATAGSEDSIQVDFEEDVYLVGTDLTLAFDLAGVGGNPGASFSSYAILLNEASWINQSTRAAATETEMREVLSDLQDLRIRGGFYTNGAGSGRLDDVVMNRNASPRPDFMVSPSIGEAGSPVSFNGSASADPDGQIAQWQWQFGDGGTAEGVFATHVYARPGVYLVTLIVTDNDGLRSPVSQVLEVGKFELSLEALSLEPIDELGPVARLSFVLSLTRGGLPIPNAPVRVRYPVVLEFPDPQTAMDFIDPEGQIGIEDPVEALLFIDEFVDEVRVEILQDLVVLQIASPFPWVVGTTDESGEIGPLELHIFGPPEQVGPHLETIDSPAGEAVDVEMYESELEWSAVVEDGAVQLDCHRVATAGVEDWFLAHRRRLDDEPSESEFSWRRGGCISYVALGDSFASGEGTFNYFPSRNRCHRARDAYAANLTFAAVAPVTLDEERFLACSGARTFNVKIGGGNAKSLDDAKGTQLDRAARTGEMATVVNEKTDLVTVSIGGNDAGFIATLFRCARSLRGCDSAGVKAAVAGQIDEAVKQAAQVYSDVSERLRAENRTAPVLVVGYPQILPSEIDPGLRHNCHLAWAFYDDQELAFVRRATSRLNAMLCAAAKAAGHYFVDIESALSGHAACSADPWLNGMLFRLPLALQPPFVQSPLRPESFHPSALAHEGYARAINAGLADLGALGSKGCPAIETLLEGGTTSVGIAEPLRPSIGDLEVALDPPSPCNATEMYVPGHGLRVRGDGFGAGEFVVVELSTFGVPYAAELGTLNADSDGIIDGSLPVPHDAPAGELGLIEAQGARADGGAHLLIAQVGSAPSATTDFDLDGALDLCDNCPLVPNDQTDSDHDGIGDDCDSCPDDPTNDTCEFFACGNGLLELGEECDDGNIADGDGCSASCDVDEGYECSGQPSVCEPLAVIGEVLLEKATAWRTRSKAGRLSLKGTFQTGLLGHSDAFDPELGMDLLVMDGRGMSVSGALDPGDCSTSPQTGKVRCRSRDRSVTGSFIPLKASPGAWRFKLFLRGLEIERPQGGPIWLHLQNGALVRQGANSNCRTTIAKLVCKR